MVFTTIYYCILIFKKMFPDVFSLVYSAFVQQFLVCIRQILHVNMMQKSFFLMIFSCCFDCQKPRFPPLGALAYQEFFIKCLSTYYVPHRGFRGEQSQEDDHPSHSPTENTQAASPLEVKKLLGWVGVENLDH